MARRPKILCIDDEEGIRRFVQEALAEQCEVCVAADGPDGLRQARWWRPDLILLDLRLPGLNGLTVLARLKAHEETSAIPVIIVSGQGDSTMLLDGQRAGAADHVIKPFDMEALQQVIRRHLLLWEDA
jgi:DNA-binding response OmpR family regulator